MVNPTLASRNVNRGLPLALVADDLREVERILEDALAPFRTRFGPLVQHLKHYRGKRLRPALVLLAGHAHSLQLSLAAAPDPPLHATAGSASGIGDLEPPEPRRVAAALAPGFGRLDVVGEGSDERLVVTLYRLLPAPLDRASSRRLVVTRYAVDLAGNAAAE